MCSHVAAVVVHPATRQHAVQVWPGNAAAASAQQHQRSSTAPILLAANSLARQSQLAQGGPWLQVLPHRCATVRPAEEVVMLLHMPEQVCASCVL